MSFRPIYAKQSKILLTRITPLKQLVMKASRLNRLQQCLNLYLSTTIQENCAVASFQNGKLTILMSNAQWATRMRYQENKLKQQLHKHHEFHDMTQISIKVSPKPLKEPELMNDLAMSQKTSKVIADTADNIKDPVLKKALERLAKNAQ